MRADLGNGTGATDENVLILGRYLLRDLEIEGLGAAWEIDR